MRILAVQESDWFERGPLQQHHLMEKLSLRNHEIRVIDFEIIWKKKPRRELFSKRTSFCNVSKAWKGSKITVIRPGILKVPLLDYISIIFTHSTEIWRQIKEFKPNVIVGFGILNTYIAMRMAKFYGIPFIYYLIDALHTLIPIKKFRHIGKALESATLRESGLVCVINEELKRYAINMGADREKVYVIRAGVDLKRFNPRINSFRLRESLGMGKDDVVLFFMGLLYPFSGLREVAIELAEVKDEQPNMKLLIVGEGNLYHELQQIKKDNSLQQLILVHWQPYEKIPEYIAASDICLLPAHNNEVMRNIVPIKMYEYMACGKPVIATRLPGIMKEFGHNKGVIYVDKPTDVLKKVVELHNDDGATRKWGTTARKFVEKYSWDKITDEFENILKATASKI